VIAGEDLSPLVALCRQCHHIVEYDNTGLKRDVWQDKERVLAELMQGRGRLALGRNKGWHELRGAGRLKEAVLPGRGVEGSVKTGARQPATSAPDAPDEHFKARRPEYEREYRRLKKLGGGDASEGRRIENEVRRSKMSPYDLGAEDAITLKSAIKMYNTRPPLQCPFAQGTPEEAEYERGWTDAMARDCR
jgi:hypothetical protein